MEYIGGQSASDLLNEFCQRAPIGSDVSKLLEEYGTPTRFYTGARAKCYAPVDARGRELFAVDEVRVWEFESRDAQIDVLSMSGIILSYQAAALPP